MCLTITVQAGVLERNVHLEEFCSGWEQAKRDAQAARARGRERAHETKMSTNV